MNGLGQGKSQKGAGRVQKGDGRLQLPSTGLGRSTTRNRPEKKKKNVNSPKEELNHRGKEGTPGDPKKRKATLIL